MQEPHDESKASWLDGRARAWRAAQHAAAGREGRWSWLRLAFFAAVVAVWFFFLAQWLLALGLSVAGLLAFVWSVRVHAAAQRRREDLDRRLTICEESRARLGGKVACVRSAVLPAADERTRCELPRLLDDGVCWQLTGQERDDLDLFAPPVGLFGLLNRTSTLNGALRLAEALQRPMLEPGAIERRQRAVRALAEAPEARLRMLAALAALRHEDRRLARFVQALASYEPLRLPLPTGLLRGWGALSALLLVATTVLALSGALAWSGALLAIATINTALYTIVLRPIRRMLAPWGETAWAVRGVEIAAAQAVEDLPDVEELRRLRDPLAAAMRPEALPRLAARIGWAEGGGAVQFLMNMCYLHEVHIAARIDQPLRARRDALLLAVAALAELEPLLSLACFAWEQPGVCWPVPAAGPLLEIRAGRHPLLPADRVKPNTVTLDAAQRMWVVTGSNMAGKSTLLRMTGLSTLLAQLGSAVPADALRWSPLRLITDLRARDDLASGESYFLAEVRHLRRMVLPPDGPGPLLGLIDEPFRGTNSQDQSAASIAVARKLIESGHLYLLATHDRHLTELADGDIVRNFHFRENLAEHGEMVFDYHLHDGPAQTRNALRVLEAEGYPPDLMRMAHEWLAQTAEGDPYVNAPEQFNNP